MSFNEASTLFITAPTSYLAIHNRAQAKKGEIVLVHAGAGGVGLMAIQIAKAIGCFVIATASTPEKLQVCKRFGADVAINYTDPEWLEEIKKASLGKGCDVIFDPVGLVEKSLKVAAWNARILVVGFAGGQIEKIATNKVLLKQCSRMGVFWGGNTLRDPSSFPIIWKGIFELLQHKQLIAPVYSKVYFGLNQVGEALRSLAARETWGKVVIQVMQDPKL